MKIICLAIFTTCLLSVSYSQQKNKHQGFKGNFIQQEYQTNYRTVNCGPDTVKHTLAKTTNIESKLFYADGTYQSGAGQYYPAASGLPITVNGFVWEGYSFNPAGGSTPINVDCEIYEAGTDSLPINNTPLASVSVNVGTSSSRIEAIFSSPVVVTSAYIVTIKNSDSNNWIVLTSNDEGNNDGQGKRLSCSFHDPSAQWKKNDDLWVLGDFDFLFYPIVKHNLTANFNPTTGCVGSVTNFSNTSSSYMHSAYYSQSTYNGLPVSYHWDYDDGNTDVYLQQGANIFTTPGTYSVELFDTLFGWTGYCTESIIRNIDIFTPPPAPSSTSPTPVCEYTTIGDLAATGNGTIFNWYDDAGLSSLLGSGTPFASGIMLPDTVYVTEVENGCEGPSTQVNIDFISNPIPQYIQNPLGGTQIQFTGAPAANSHLWDFGDGAGMSTIQTPTYTYGSAGPFTVCLDVTYANTCTNQYCETITFVGIDEQDENLFGLYPNPTNSDINISLTEIKNNTYFELYQADGKLLEKEILTSLTTTINMSKYPNNFYFIKVYSGNNYSVKRITKH